MFTHNHSGIIQDRRGSQSVQPISSYAIFSPFTMITPNVCMIMSHKELRQACDCPTYEYHVHNQIKILFDFGIYGFGILWKDLSDYK